MSEDDSERHNPGPTARWLYSIATALFLAGVTGGVGAWRIVAVHDIQISDLYDWRRSAFFASERYTPDNARTDREASAERDASERRERQAADAYLVGQLSELKSELLDLKRQITRLREK